MSRASQPADDLSEGVAAFAESPWLGLRRRALGGARRVPTMLTEDEQRLYWWLAHKWSDKRRAIVDLGCFAGGSAACLAEGARRGATGARVHAFDRFRADEAVKERILYPAGVAPFEGDDIRPLAEAFLAPWGDAVALYPGQIEAQDWQGGPIGVLTVDAAKTASVADRIAQVFFPHLVPGRSVLVQQDLLHWKQPWLAAQMAGLAGVFRPVAHVRRSSVVFLYTGPVAAADLDAARVSERSDGELIAALERAADLLAPLGVARQVAGLAEAVRANPNARRAKRFTERPGPGLFAET